MQHILAYSLVHKAQLRKAWLRDCTDPVQDGLSEKDMAGKDCRGGRRGGGKDVDKKEGDLGPIHP